MAGTAYNLRAPMRTSALRLVVALGVAPVLAQNAAPDHPEPYASADVMAGARIYNATCVNCHGVSGTGVGGIDLRHGLLPRARTDAALQAVIATGFPQSGMPAFHLDANDVRGLVAFIRSGLDTGEDAAPVTLGDAARGRGIVEGKGNCLTCHRLHEQGQFAGPDLTDVGRAINRPVKAVTRDGRVVTGRRLNEDTYTVQIITDQGRLVSLVKSDLREWSVGATSQMPSYKDALAPGELADVLAYLVSLKG
jgi:mono/diheme cytochrome c family protein